MAQVLVDPALSTASLSPQGPLLANAQDQATIRVELRDAANQPLAGRTIFLNLTGVGQLAASQLTSDAQGLALTSLSSSAAGRAEVLVTADPSLSNVLLGPLSMDFIAPAPATPVTPTLTTDPSNGSGGQAGLQVRNLSVNGQTVEALIYAPSNYDPAQSWPVHFVFHGQGGSRDITLQNWIPIAQAEGFIVAATQSTGSTGGWSFSSDVPIFGALLQELDRSFNVDRRRRTLWGFSAGGHFVQTVALANSQFFAAYGASAGVLTQAVTPTNRIPCSMVIGLSDPLLAGARQTRDYLVSIGHTVMFHEFQGGHQVDSSHRLMIWNDIKSYRRP